MSKDFHQSLLAFLNFTSYFLSGAAIKFVSYPVFTLSVLLKLLLGLAFFGQYDQNRSSEGTMTDRRSIGEQVNNLGVPF